jgi:16S rRNA (guanine527-N7)-methyltransferase
MPALPEARIADLLSPYLATLPADFTLPESLIPQIGRYLDLLVLWNARTNLTAIREPAALVQRQIGESLVAVRFVAGAQTLLDFGSGGGFPGIPLQLALPQLKVTLAESQGKKASFLREVVRTLGLASEVVSSRVENMAGDRVFDAVAMRAVDATTEMLPIAMGRVAPGGSLLRYLGVGDAAELGGWKRTSESSLPLSPGRLVRWTRD